MEVRTVIDEGLGNASYLVELGEGRALVVDPGRDPGPYMEAARQSGSTIAFVAETHLHADFVSGSRELNAEGATVLASAGADLGFEHHPLRDDEHLDLGGLTLRALATPGHTPEHLSYELLDGPNAAAVFTGGALLRGSVARTDLLSSEETEPLARALFRSVHDRLFALPDDTPVYPTHGAGATFCSVTPTDDGDPSTTIGREREGNILVQAPDELAFARGLMATYGSYPRYFTRLREVNRRGPRVYGTTLPSLEPLSPERVQRALAEGAVLIDARPIDPFADGHVPGALSIALRPAFATWLGWLVPAGTPLVFVLADDQDRTEVVRQCLKVGYEGLDGELAGGMTAWRQAGVPEERSRLLGSDAVPEGTILDVRQRNEYTQGHAPGAVNVELGSLEGEVDSLPRGPITMHCGHGERAMTAASLLAHAGRTDVSVLQGGPGDICRVIGRQLARGNAP
jgi:glyoxylase-like metal-dependent hydrolase (beta-lactamase superfamily II)/rhodanese-related sulfurtransferase